MKVDAHISKAIEQYLIDHKTTNAAHFAAELGVSAPTLIKWRRPGNGITPRRWIKLFPYIRAYLPTDRIYLDQTGQEQYSSMTDSSATTYTEPRYIPQMVPVFSAEHLRKYSPLLSVAQFSEAENISERAEYRPRIRGFGGIFAFKAVDADAVFGVPADAIAFVSTEAKPRPGLVLGVERGGVVFIGNYSADSSSFSIDLFERQIRGRLSEVASIVSLLCPVAMYEVVCAKE